MVVVSVSIFPFLPDVVYGRSKLLYTGMGDKWGINGDKGGEWKIDLDLEFK